MLQQKAEHPLNSESKPPCNNSNKSPVGLVLLPSPDLVLCELSAYCAVHIGKGLMRRAQDIRSGVRRSDLSPARSS